MLVYRDTGEVELIVTKSRELIEKIFSIADSGSSYRGKIIEIKTSDKPEAFEIYQKHGHQHIFKSYRYFKQTRDDEIIKELESTDMKTYTFDNKEPAESLRESIKMAVREAIYTEIYGKQPKQEIVFNITPDMDLGEHSPIELLKRSNS